MKGFSSNTTGRKAGDGARAKATGGIERWLQILAGHRWIFGLFLVTATMIAYQPVWHAGFIWDDDDYVTNNPTLRSLAGLRQIWCHLAATPQYYPLVHTSFWLEYHLWGLNPPGYHVVNVLLHALAAILLWRVLARLRLPGAWLAAGIFALHPVAVESVAWVTERKNVLAAVFYFAAALAYLRTTGEAADGGKQIRGSYRWYFLSLALFVAALLSKTVACSLPAAMLLVIWWKRGRIAGRDVRPLLPFFAAGMAMGLMTSWLERIHVGAQGPDWAFSFPERCLIAGRALWFYAGKLFWPANLTFIYPRWQINAGVWWQWLFPAAALAVVAALWSLRRRIGRGPLAAALFFGGTLLPALGFTNVYPMRYTFVADHYQYLAGIGLMALAVAGITTASGFLGKRNLFLKPAFCGALLLTLGALTWSQCRMYADVETLWRTTIARNPACWMACNNLGLCFENKGRIDEAVSQYQEAIRLKPDYAESHNNLGNALNKKGRIDEAVSEYREALRLNPDFPEAHNNLGAALLTKGQLDESIRQFEEAIRLKPDSAETCYNLGNAFGKKGQTDEAISQYQQAIRLQPDYADAHLNLGLALLNKGRTDEAISQFQETIRFKPDDVRAHYNLGFVLLNTGQADGAISQFQEAIRLNPDDAGAHYNLGNALDKKGRTDEAISQYQEAIRLEPDSAEAHNDLGNALFKKNQIDGAISQYQEAIRLKADNAEAHNNLGLALGNKGRTDEAISQIQEAIRIEPDYAEAYNNLGVIFSRQNRIDGAISQFQEAIRLKPGYANAQNNLTKALEMKGKTNNPAKP